jgi:hypothetical protein
VRRAETNWSAIDSGIRNARPGQSWRGLTSAKRRYADRQLRLRSLMLEDLGGVPFVLPADPLAAELCRDVEAGAEDAALVLADYLLECGIPLPAPLVLRACAALGFRQAPAWLGAVCKQRLLGAGAVSEAW